MVGDKVRISARPPSFLDPSRRPQVFSESGVGIVGQPKKEIPRAVAAAGIAALAKAHRHGDQAPLTQTQASDFRSRCRSQGQSTPRGGLAMTSWTQLVGSNGKHKQFDVVNEPLSLTADIVARENRPLLFGENIRLLQQDDKAAISTVPPTCAAELEAALTYQFAGSGREHKDFIAVTAVLPKETSPGCESSDAAPPSRRNVWEIYRANPLDGYPDNVVHYGQLLRFGQSLGATWTCPQGDQDEVLLSCEPPASGGGADAPYLVLARVASFGHPHTGDEKRIFDTTFCLVPASCADIDSSVPVDLREPVLLIPVSPYAYGHKSRFVHVSLGGRSHRKQVRTLAPLGPFNEFSLEASLKNPHPAAFNARREQGIQYKPFNADAPTGWIVERVALQPGSLQVSGNIQQEVHTGLPRALLGRSLPIPRCPISDFSSTSSCRDSRYARWEVIRTTLLRRIVERGTFGFILFRRALSVLSQAVLLKCDQHKVFEWAAPLSESELPSAGDAPRADERCVLRAEDVAAVLLSDYGVQLQEEDLFLLARTFAVGPATSKDRLQQVVNGDRFADALRGEPSPKRHQCLLSLYSQLQKDAGLGQQGCLDSGWLANRLWESRPKELPGVQLPPFTPDELLGTLPLLCSHPLLSRTAFLRCAADLAFNVGSQSAFESFIRSTWGISQLEPLASLEV